MLYEVITDGAEDLIVVEPHAGPDAVDQRAAEEVRITSYNVCYTKLLRVSGGDAELVRRIKDLPGVETATAMGAEVHVAGGDAAALKADLDRLAAAENLRWRAEEPNLEDVFIHLMARNPDPTEARR